MLCSRCKQNETNGIYKRCLSCLEYMRSYKATHGRHPNTVPGKCSYSDCSNDSTPGYKSCPRCRKRARSQGRSQVKSHVELRRKRQELKLLVFSAYGGPKCACCGETSMEFLSIDHKDGGGAEHRKELTGNSQNGANLYYWLKNNGFPPGFRVLCMNCNFALGHFGYCPHGLVVQSEAS